MYVEEVEQKTRGGQGAEGFSSFTQNYRSTPLDYIDIKVQHLQQLCCISKMYMFGFTISVLVEFHHHYHQEKESMWITSGVWEVHCSEDIIAKIKTNYDFW